MNRHAFEFIYPQLLAQGWPCKVIELVLRGIIPYKSNEVKDRFKFASLSYYTKKRYIIDHFLGVETPYKKFLDFYIQPLPFSVPTLPPKYQVIYLNFLYNKQFFIPFTFNSSNDSNAVNLTKLTYGFKPIHYGFSREPFFPCINRTRVGNQPGYMLDLIEFFTYGFFFFPYNDLQVGTNVRFRGPYPYATEEKSHIKHIYKNYFRIDFFYQSRDSSYYYASAFDDET